MNYNRTDHISEQELLEKFYHSKDNQWLGLVLQRYTLLLLGVCMKYLKNEEEARDSVQQIFLKAITELHKYKVDYFKSWLYMVAKNHCLMKIRDRQGKQSVEMKEQTLMIQDEGINLSHHIEKDRKLELLGNCLKDLNQEQQVCVTLFYIEKKSYQEIANFTGFNMMQVKSHIQNGKRNLKLMLEKKLGANPGS